MKQNPALSGLGAAQVNPSPEMMKPPKTVRLIVHPEIGPDRLFVQPKPGRTNAERAEREKDEAHARDRFAAKFFYADPYTGNTRTFDPTGRYNCGGCNQAEGKKCELIGIKLVLDLEAGSCYGYELQDAGDPEQDFGPDGVSTAEEMSYGVAANGVGFGCIRCPFASKAYEADSKGRDRYCGKGNFRVFWNACCKINGAKVLAKYEGNEPVENDEDDDEYVQ